MGILINLILSVQANKIEEKNKNKNIANILTFSFGRNSLVFIT